MKKKNLRKKTVHVIRPTAGCDQANPFCPTKSVVNDKQQAMKDSPKDVMPPGTVPQARESHGDHKISDGFEFAETISSERDIEIIAQPCREADMPASPKFAWRGGKIGKVKVGHQVKTQAFP